MDTVKMTGDSMIKLVLTDMDDTLIPAGHDGVSDYAIEGIHARRRVCTLSGFGSSAVRDGLDVPQSLRVLLRPVRFATAR